MSEKEKKDKDKSEQDSLAITSETLEVDKESERPGVGYEIIGG